MNNQFMRLLLFYDLPMINEKDKRTYQHFRKYLLKNGYMLIQFSVYSKIFSNRDSATKHLSMLKNNLPKYGSVRTMLVTEKQYARMEVLVGNKSKLEEQVTADSFIVF